MKFEKLSKKQKSLIARLEKMDDKTLCKFIDFCSKEIDQSNFLKVRIDYRQDF